MQPVNSSLYRDIEARFGHPMREILVVLLTRMSREQAAHALGVNPLTLDRYLSANMLALRPRAANRVTMMGTDADCAQPAVAAVQAILGKVREPAAAPVSS